jgi:hypothetical protein
MALFSFYRGRASIANLNVIFGEFGRSYTVSELAVMATFVYPSHRVDHI